MPRSYPAASLVLLLVACGGGDRRVAEPSDGEASGPRTQRTPPVDDESEDGVEIESSKGHLEPHQIEAGVRPHQGALSACYHDQLKATRFVGGSIELSFVVRPDGAVDTVKLSKGDLGSWPVERCMLEVGRAMRFAAPRGKAAAEFTLPLDFQSGKGNVIWWPDEVADAAMVKHAADLDACSDEAEGSPRDVWVTLYVGPRGQVKSIGFASPGRPIDDGWAECVVEKSARWALTDPRGKIAKAGFRYRPE
jgi:TonB family protein